MGRSLVLNADYEPHSVVADRRALRLIWADKAEVLQYSGREFHSPSTTVLVPSVIRLVKFVVMPLRHRSVMLTTRAVLARDGHICAYCGGVANTMDHVEPRSRGGRHVWENVVASCSKCNSEKDDYLLPELVEIEALKLELGEPTRSWELLYAPSRPEGVAAYLLSISPEAEWLEYLQVA
jgi:5-methylcytosine-specific restriction endonuclease McrA